MRDEIQHGQDAHEMEQETHSQESTAADEPVKQYPMEVSPKEWQKHHDTWLNAVMRNTIGEPKPPRIPNLHAHIPVFRPSPDLDIDVAPVKNYVTRYDLQIKVEAGENQVKLFHQAFCKWFLKLREADSHTIIYLWAERVCNEEGLLIKNPMDIPIALLLLKKFTHKLFLCMSGGAYHIQVLLGTKEDLATIMETIGWWLKSINQGMWRTDLQTAEESLCAGWLQFLAEEYDREALSQEIWNLTGVHVALWYQAIDDGEKKDTKTKSTPVKVLHIKIDRIHQMVTRSQIEYLYSSKATVFLLGFKMQLVHNHQKIN